MTWEHTGATDAAAIAAVSQTVTTTDGKVDTVDDKVDVVDDKVDKIDDLATLGLAGVHNSLAYRVQEIERHLHSYEHWFGAAVIPDGEGHQADHIGDTTTAFQVDAGNNTWSAWLQILGSEDTPHAMSNMAYYDMHRLAIVSVERANATHFVQIGFGISAAAALAADTITEFVFRPQTVQGSEMIVEVQMRRLAVGTKAWFRAWAVGADTGTLSFFFGTHEYEG